jgi:type VI secretion system secreted protein Hcp
MFITGQKQGKFQGEGAAEWKNWIPILAFTLDLTVPTDSGTGQASGKRQYQPLTIIKTWGTASPQALTACSTNEVLPTVSIQFLTVDPTGRESAFQNVNLTNARLRAIRRYIGDPQSAQGLQASSSEATGLEQWSFVFQKIDIDDVPGSTTFADDWLVES